MTKTCSIASAMIENNVSRTSGHQQLLPDINYSIHERVRATKPMLAVRNIAAPYN